MQAFVLVESAHIAGCPYLEPITAVMRCAPRS
jgi:hypothetical protein